MQLFGASLDLQGQYYFDASSKLVEFRNTLKNGSNVNKSIFKNNSSIIGACVNEESDNVLVDSLLADEFDELAEFEKQASNVDIRKFYMKLINSKHSSNDDDSWNEIPIHDSSNKQLLQRFITDLSAVSISLNLFKSIFMLIIESYIIQFMVEYQQNKSTHSGMDSSRFAFFLKLIESYYQQFYFVNIKFLSENSCNRIPLKANMDEQLSQGPMGHVFLKLCTHHILYLTERGMLKEAVSHLDKLVLISSSTFPIIQLRCKLYLERARTIYKLIKHKHLKTASKLFIIDCAKFSDALKSSSISSNDKTPPQQSKIVQIRTTRKTLLKAPRAKQLFADNDERAYAQSVLELASNLNEDQENTRRNLNFDDLEEDMSGLTISESVIKNKKQTKVVKAHGVYKNESSQEPETECKFARTLDHPLELDVSEFDNDDLSESSFFGQFFRISQFNMDLYTIDEIKNMLNRIHFYISSHPSTELFKAMHEMYFKLTLLMSRSRLTSSYYFSESFDYSSLRYRCIQTASKKQSLKKELPFGLEDVVFKIEDYTYSPYLNNLPKQWRFVSVKIEHKQNKQFPDLIISRLQKGSYPIILKFKCNQEKVSCWNFLTFI